MSNRSYSSWISRKKIAAFVYVGLPHTDVSSLIITGTTEPEGLGGFSPPPQFQAKNNNK